MSSATSSVTAPSRSHSADATEVEKAARLDGDYLSVDLVQVAAGLGATASAPEHRRRAARRAGRHPRTPGHGRHRGPGDPARRPARRGVWWDVAPAEVSEVRHRAGSACRVRAGPQDPAVVRMSPTLSSPLDNGALARAVRGRGLHLGHLSGHGLRRSPRRCVPLPGSTGCCSTWSTAPAARSRSRDVVPAAGAYGVPTVVRVESDARIRMGRVLDNGAAGVMLPRHGQCDAGQPGADPHLRYPAAWRPRGGHLQPGLPVRARPRRA